jgi:hypothetical protein
MVNNPQLTESEWDGTIRKIKALPDERQEQLLAIIRTFFVDDI